MEQSGRMQVPDDLRYTEEHEWVSAISSGVVRLGITDYAQDQLGDIVYVQQAEVGTRFERGGVIAEVESTKSVGEVYAPWAGMVVAVNPAVSERPELLNQDPYGEGWLIELEVDPAGLEGLLDADAYRALIG
jgi:glycine cleavage system H protein